MHLEMKKNRAKSIFKNYSLYLSAYKVKNEVFITHSRTIPY